jgi:copper chaperone CopZ
MRTISKMVAAMLLLFSFSFCSVQIRNAKTESVKIYGNCAMCEKTIETAGNVGKVAMVDWDKDNKMATITYDSTKTNKSEILKRIALAGYDSDYFLAPDEVYGKLAGCCQYERVNKPTISPSPVMEDHSMHNQEVVDEEKQEVNHFKAVYDNYFDLKDALVKSDEKSAARMAKELSANIMAVKMNELSSEEHTVWMKVLGTLKSNTAIVSSTADLEKQRIAFMEISEKLYDLLQVSKQDYSIYYQHCPMYNDGKGANWLSKENAIKNPYYGSQMLTCGSTIETMK